MNHPICPNCLQLHDGQRHCPRCGYDVTIPNAPHQLPVGTSLQNRYRIGKVLGQGGFGITYLGWDMILNIPVAIKEYYPTGSVLRSSAVSLKVSCMEQYGQDVYRRNLQRFFGEAQLLSRLSSVPEIVRVLNFFQENDTAYIVMEYLNGIALKAYVQKQGRLSWETAAPLLQSVLSALRQVHSIGLLHRDISPDNIMLMPDGSTKLLDFGASRALINRDKNHALTKSTQAIVKPGYTPIEQYQTRGVLGPWTDLYAFCAVFYYCLTGQEPMEAPERMIEGQNIPWQQIPGLPPHAARALEQGTALMVEQRTASAEDLYRMLYTPAASVPEAQCQEPPVQKAPVPPKKEEPVPEPAQKKKRPLLPLLLMGILLAAAVCLVLFFSGKEPAPAPETEPASVTEATAETTVPTTEATEPFDDSAWRDNVLMADPWISGLADPWVSGTEENTAFGSAIPRSQILSVTFLDSLSTEPEDSWDVSANGDNRVKAWAEEAENGFHLTIAAEGGINAANCESLFQGYSALEKITFQNAFHTTYATDMSSMFSGCYCLQELDLRQFDTAQVQSMNSMFDGCLELFQLDISSFDTAMVTDMAGMFSGCLELNRLDVDGFDTRNVTDMNSMFACANSLTDLDVSGFDTGNVTNMSYMFQCCTNLSKLDLSGFDTGNVTSMHSMFALCRKLYAPDVEYFDLSQNPDVSLIFLDCPASVGTDPERFPPDDPDYETMMIMIYESKLDPTNWKNPMSAAMLLAGLL